MVIIYRQRYRVQPINVSASTFYKMTQSIVYSLFRGSVGDYGKSVEDEYNRLTTRYEDYAVSGSSHRVSSQ